jgi:hypothetical protein
MSFNKLRECHAAISSSVSGGDRSRASLACTADVVFIRGLLMPDRLSARL